MGVKPRPDLKGQFGERPGLGRFAAQGAFQGVEGLASLIDLVRARGNTEVVDTPAGATIERQPLESLLADRVRQAQQSMVGSTVKPEGFLERATQSATRGVTESIPTLPLAAIPGLGGAMALGPRAVAGSFARNAGIDLLSGFSGEVARGEAENAGFGTGGQIGASMLGALGTTGTLSRIAQTTKPVRGRTARSLARQALGRNVNNRRQAIELLDEELNKKLFGAASTDQVLQDRFPGVAGVMRRAARDSASADDLRLKAAELRQLSSLDAVDKLGKKFPGGRPVDTSETYINQLARVQNKVTRAYKKTGNLAGVPTRKLKAGAAFIAQDAGDELDHLLPKRALKIIEGYGETTNLRSLQRLRRSLGASVRKAKRKGDRERLFFLNKLVDSVEQTFDEVAEEFGSVEINALRRARIIRAIEAERFDPSDPLNKVFGGELKRGEVVLPEDMGREFNRFLGNSKTPAQDLRRLRLTLGRNPRAWGGVQRLMRDRVFGEDFELLFNVEGNNLTMSGANRALKNLRKNAESFDVVYGPDAAKNAENFIRRARQLSRGVVGTTGEFATTGTGFKQGPPVSLEQIGIGADLARGDFKGAAFSAFRLAMGRTPKTIEEADVLLSQAMVDPALAKAFLEELPAEAVDAWQRRARNFLAVPVRSTAGAVGRTGER